MQNAVNGHLNNGVQHVVVSGEVDLSWSQDVRDALLKVLKLKQPTVVDLSQVSYIDSSGIAALVEGFKLAKEQSQPFALLQPAKSVRAVLELARLNKVFRLIDSAAEL
jgi:anti-sigma B factor antagonist